MLPEAAGVKDMSLVERVAWAIIAANERRERSATHGMEIVVEAALEASGHAELVEENKSLKRRIRDLEGDCDSYRKTLAVIDEVANAEASKYTGEQS